MDFYLSEMSPSESHGGGLTLHRVLGTDMERVSRFIHVSRFAQDFPAPESLRSRCMNLPMWMEHPDVKKCVGCRPAAWLAQRRFLRRQHARQAAAAIWRRFSHLSRPLRGFICPQGSQSLLVLEELKRQCEVRYVTWIMDDHIIRFRNNSWHYPHNCEPVMARHLQDAERVFVISHAMGEFYLQRFGADNEVLMPPAEHCAEPMWSAPSVATNCRLGYFGNLGPWPLDAITRIEPLLLNAGVSLDIYSPSGQSGRRFSSPAIRLCGTLPRSELLSRMRSYDALLLPISFADSERQFSEFNIAMRMGEFLASGNVTFVVGPAYAAMVNYLKRANAACIVTQPEAAQLGKAFALIKDSSYRREVLVNAARLVESDLSLSAARLKWRWAFQQVVGEQTGASALTP